MHRCGSLGADRPNLRADQQCIRALNILTQQVGERPDVKRAGARLAINVPSVRRRGPAAPGEHASPGARQQEEPHLRWSALAQE